MRKINGEVYRISNDIPGNCFLIECESEDDLMRSLANLEKNVMLITNVVRIEAYNNSIKTPKVAFRNNAIFKKYKENL